MMKQAAVLAKIAPNICIKLPLTFDGLKACKALTSEGHKTNVTLCFSAVPKRCSPPRPARPSFRPSSAVSTMSASTAWT